MGIWVPPEKGALNGHQVRLAQEWARHGRVLFVVPTEARAAAARKALVRPWLFGGGAKAIAALQAEVVRLGAALVLDCALVGHADFGALRDMTLSANGPIEQARQMRVGL